MRKLILIFWSTAILAGAVSVAALGQSQAHGLFTTVATTTSVA